MRFPLSLTTSMVGYMARKKLSGTKRFPLVLMLEPLHACNLTCTGCGRIREYSPTIKDKLTVEECLASVDEAGAPIVSICGGEPLIYPDIGRLVKGILKRRKHIYLCTNGMFIRKRLHEFRPTSRFYFNVHLDGLKTLADAELVFDGLRIFADAAAAGAGEVAGVQRLKHQHQREAPGARQLVPGDVARHGGGECQGETHGHLLSATACRAWPCSAGSGAGALRAAA